MKGYLIRTPDGHGEKIKAPKTVRGYDFGEVASAMQKAIRRGDARLAGYWAMELLESGYAEYTWRRLLVISAEDCWGILTQEVTALHEGFQLIRKHSHKPDHRRGRIFLAKAVILLCQAKKCRDADHLNNLVYDPKAIDDQTLETDLDAAREQTEPVPAYALDTHTERGRKAGKTKRDFFLEEFEALNPRQPGLFDEDVEKVRRKKEAT